MDQSTLLTMVYAAIFIVLVFDYTNGFHDASNIIGTIIASRAMTPVQSVLIVAVFELLGPVLGGTAVANTIGKTVKISDMPQLISIALIIAGISGAIFWNMLTWYYGIPSSSSHALVGGLVGAVWVAAGADHVVWGIEVLLHKGKLDGVVKVFASLILSPIVGFWVGFFLMRFTNALFRGAKPSINKIFKGSQYLTAAWLAFSHGSNDAQKSMGIITLILGLGGLIPANKAGFYDVPMWVIYSCAGVITLGIMSGGWRIVRTVGFGIYKVRPLHSMNAQFTAAGVIYFAAISGFPVSTTHCASSAIMGVGASERPKDVRWSKAKEIFATWVITMPSAGLVGAIFFTIAKLLF